VPARRNRRQVRVARPDTPAADRSARLHRRGLQLRRAPSRRRTLPAPARTHMALGQAGIAAVCVKRPPFAVPGPGSCASLGCTWQLQAVGGASHPQGETMGRGGGDELAQLAAPMPLRGPAVHPAGASGGRGVRAADPGSGDNDTINNSSTQGSGGLRARASCQGVATGARRVRSSSAFYVAA